MRWRLRWHIRRESDGYFTPKAEDVVPYLQPDTGHATDFSLNASAGYEVMLDFLDMNEL
jgi:hypothetical protein